MRSPPNLAPCIECLMHTAEQRMDRPSTAHPCPSTFDRWSCQRTVGHTGLHAARTGSEEALWNDTAAGKSIRHLTSKCVPIADGLPDEYPSRDTAEKVGERRECAGDE